MSSDANIQGWDLIYKLIENDVNKKEDLLIAFIHLILINSKYQCIGLGENKTLSGNEKPSELLPCGWNADSCSYSLKYIYDGKLFFLKGLKVDDDTVLTLLKLDGIAHKSIAFNINNTVKSLKGDSLKDIIPNFKEVFKKVCSDLIESNLNREVTTQTSNYEQDRYQPRASLREPTPHYSDLAVPRSWPSARVDPFEYGRADLDPVGRGTGMIFDPFTPEQPPHQPGLGVPGQLPRGAIPPGSRYDPMGPPDLERRPRPQLPPDSDELTPPDYENMYM